MAILDTDVAVEMARRGRAIVDNVTEVTVAEYPAILRYRLFRGKVYLARRVDWRLAVELQSKLIRLGRPKKLQELLVAAIAINRGERLLSRNKGLADIVKVAGLKLTVI